jgi:hypothetical protein
MARDPRMVYWVAILLLSFLLLSSEQQQYNNDDGRLFAFVDSFTIAPVVMTTIISTANTKARRITPKLPTSRISRTSKMILFSSVNENEGEGDVGDDGDDDDDDDDDDGWGTETTISSSDSSSSDDTKNRKIKELKLLQQQQQQSSALTQRQRQQQQQQQAGGTEQEVVERDLFIPIFAVVSLLGLFGSYGYETLRLASRGELYLPWQQ